MEYVSILEMFNWTTVCLASAVPSEEYIICRTISGADNIETIIIMTRAPGKHHHHNEKCNNMVELKTRSRSPPPIDQINKCHSGFFAVNNTFSISFFRFNWVVSLCSIRFSANKKHSPAFTHCHPPLLSPPTSLKLWANMQMPLDYVPICMYNHYYFDVVTVIIICAAHYYGMHISRWKIARTIIAVYTGITKTREHDSVTLQFALLRRAICIASCAAYRDTLSGAVSGGKRILLYTCPLIQIHTARAEQCVGSIAIEWQAGRQAGKERCEGGEEHTEIGEKTFVHRKSVRLGFLWRHQFIIKPNTSSSSSSSKSSNNNQVRRVEGGWCGVG